MFDRFSNWLEKMFICLDQLFCVWLRGFGYVWFGKGELPSADETLSSFIGRMAIEGHRSALIAEKVIDFFLGANHCRRAIQRDDND